MNLQTFRAATMAEALTQVKGTLGTDAVILHTRTFLTRYCLGLRRREVVEITATRGCDMPVRNRRQGGGNGTGGAAPARGARSLAPASAYSRAAASGAKGHG